MNRINIIFIIALVPVVIFAGYILRSVDFFPFVPHQDGFQTVYINRVPIHVEIADTRDKQLLGLSGREYLSSNSGLLLAFDTFELHGIWMKDMLFPIDIIWLVPITSSEEEGLRIVDIKHDVGPESFPTVFYPRERALYVLEVSAGFAEVHNFRIGDTVRFE